MKKSSDIFLLIVGLVLVTAGPVFATASVSTLASTNLSADTASSSYTRLTGPVLTEGANRDISATGTLTLNVPSGFQFNPSAAVTVTVTRIAGSGTAVTLASSGAATVTPSNLTVTVTAIDASGTTRSSLTWSGIQVQPIVGTPLASGNITKSGIAITGITSGSTSFGALTEVAGAPNRLIFSVPPAATTTAGVAMANFVVQVQDQFGSAVATSGVPIAVALNGGAFASGTTNTTTGAGGSATFSALIVNTTGSYTVTASDAGLTPVTSGTIKIVPATASSVQITQDAVPPVTAGVQFSPSVTVRVADAFSNVITNKTVTMNLLGGGALSGTVARVTDASGIATFNDLSISGAGAGKVLTATITSPTIIATGSTFAVDAAAAIKLGFTVAPTATTTAGVTMATFTVQIQDAFGNAISSNDVPITLALSTGDFASGTTTVNTGPGGSATFTNLVITAANSYTLTASSADFSSTSAGIAIVPAAVSTFQFQTDVVNSPITAGATITPSVVVQAMDQYNNPVNNKTVTMSLNAGTLLGTLARATDASGLATFNDLRINTVGTNYILIADISAPAMSVTGVTFNVTNAAPAKLVYTTSPAITNIAGDALADFTVQMQDSFGNAIPTEGVPLTMSLANGTFASGNTSSNTDANGTAAFTGLVVTNSGINTLIASGGGLPSTNKPLVIVVAGAKAINFIQAPPDNISAGSVFTNTVSLRDLFGNAVTNTTVTLNLIGGGPLNGTTARATALNGIASFTNLSINVVGASYNMIATVGSLSVTSSTFAINVGPLHHYAITVSPPLTRGSAFNITVTAQDVVSNTVVADNSTVVTMTGSTPNLQFDSNGDSTYGDNTKTLSAGTFAINTVDGMEESVTVTASDANGKTGSALLAITPAGGDYRSAATGPWSATSTWQTWDGASWVGATTPPAGGAGTNITILSTHRVTNNTAIALSGTLVTQGSLTFAGGSMTVGSGGILLNSGAVTSSVSTLIFNADGTYKHNFTSVVGAVPVATWNTNSTCAIIGYTSFAGNPAGLNQSFYNFVWNCTTQSTAISLGGALANVAGDFTVLSTGGGTLQGANTATLNLTIGGDMNLRGGTFLGSVSGSANAIKIGGSYNQTGGSFSQGANDLLLNFTGANKSFTQSAGTLNTTHMNFAVTNNATLSLNSALAVVTGQSFTVKTNGALNCGANVISGAGAFTLSSGASLGIGSADGITSSGALGNIQTASRNFNAGANYIYNGSVSQITGSGLPGAVSSLTIANTGGIVALSSAVSITGNLTISAGAFDLGVFTVNRATSGGAITVANGTTLKIGGANTFPANYTTINIGPASTIEYEGADQNVAAQSYGHLATSGSGAKFLQSGATSIAGNLTIGVGTAFDAGTNDFSLAGDWINNGSDFTFNGPQTVSFNGSGPQTIDGTSLTTFNKVAIDTGSVLNLVVNDTALALRIAAVDEPAGTWGATGSGATNIDDTHFQGTGTLNVTPATFGIAFLQDAPSSVTAGDVFSPPVTVQVTGSFSNLIINKMVTLTLNGGGTLNGTFSEATDTNGVARFTNLNVTVYGTNYSLVASIINPSLSVTGSTFVVNRAAASQVVYTTAPGASVTAGDTLPTIVAQVEDAFGNVIPTNDVLITVSLGNGSFASGTTALLTTADGFVTFADLMVTNAGPNTLSVSALNLTGASSAIAVLPASFAITFQQDAPAVASAGVVFSPPVAVRIADPFNNVLSNTIVTLTLNGGGVLNGTTARATAANGIATFTNLTVNTAATNYSLTASTTSPALSITGNTFIVNPSVATKLAYSTLPAATNTAGQTLPTFVVQVRDQFDNNILTNDVPITMTLNTGTFSSGANPVNTTPYGSATFSDLVITNAGNNILIASAIGLASTNRPISILPDAASNSLTFIQGPPSAVTAGSVFTNTVKVADQFNNGISNATITLSLNGAATLNGTLARTTSGSGIATFTNLSVNTPGTGYSITATSGSLMTTSAVFDVTVGPIHHYVVSATSPQARGSSFNVTVTAQDAVSNTVSSDSSTLVTMNASTPTVVFDGTGDDSFANNTHILSSGTFSLNALDNLAEIITMTATDGSGKYGTSSNIVVNAAAGDFRSAATGPWNATNTWQVWDGASWIGASTTPAGGVGTNITIQSTHTVTNNVAVGLTGVILNQGTLNFSGSGAITVGSGGIVLNSGVVNSSATTLILNSGGTYDHARNGGTISIAAYNSNSLLRVSGITSTIATLPTTGLNGNVEWNCPTQTVATAIILAVSGGGTQTIGGDFNIVSTGSGSIIGGGTTARSLNVLGNMTVRGGTYNAIGGNGSSAGNVSVTVAKNLTINGGDLSMVVGEGTTSSFNVSGVLTVGGNLSVSSGTLTVLTGTTYASSGVSSMTVSGITTVAGGTLTLTDATSGNANGVTANLKGDLTISGGTIRRAGSLPGNVNFNGTAPQTYSKSNGAISGAVNFAIASGATVNFGTSLLDGSTGTFALNSGGAIGIGDSLGITTSGAAGNIRVSGTRTYSIGGTYAYNGPASQATGNGLPSTVRSLVVSNASGVVALGSSVTVSNNLTVSAGAFDLGSFTANRATSGGTITVANGAALRIGGTSFPSNYTTRNLGATSTVEYEGAAQNVAALTYGHLITSGSDVKTLQAGATSIAGDLTIGSGTTLEAGTNNFSLAGSWNNNGDAFTSSGSQTVSFNGSSPQSVGGLTATSFNKVEINSGSVLNLALDNTAAGLSIAGVNKAAGIWGASGSGASNVDDVHFQGISGRLNVSTGPTTTTTLSSSSNPAPYNSPVTLTATVVGSGGTPPPTGTVTFMEGISALDTATLSGSPTGTATFITSTLSPVVHNITAVYSGDSSFAGSTSSVLEQQINVSYPLAITANSTNKTYGETVVFAGTEFTAIGLQPGDSVTSVTLTSDGAASGANAGSHTIFASNAVGSGLGNYVITYENGTLTVGTASVAGSIIVSDKIYDGTNSATITGRTLAGVLGGGDVQLTGGTATFDTKDVGNNKVVTAVDLTLTGAAAGNYALVSSTVTTNASISPAPLTVTADNKARPFSATNPELTVSYTTFASGDDTNNALSGAPNVSTTAVTNSPLGTYPINVSTGNLSAVNYTLSFGNGTLTVGATNLTVTADDQTRSYGATNPVLTVTYSGFVGSDDASILSGAPDVSTTADTNSTVAGSPYDIIVTNGTLSATNYYNFVFVNGKLTVDAAVITVTADNKTKVYGDPVPPLTASYSGFVNDETTNVFSGAPALSTSAVSNSPVAGSPYPITVTSNTLTAANYTFSFNDGTLTVTAAPLTGRVAVSDKLYDATTTATISNYVLSGAIGDDDVSLTGGTANFDSANVGNNKVVTVTGLTLSGTTAGSYSLLSDTVTTNASITAAYVTGSISASNKVYDGTTTAVIGSSGLSGVISNDDVTLIVGAAEFIDKDVGNGKLVNANLLSLTGAATGNYTLSSSSASTVANITPAPLEVSADNKAKTQGLPNPPLTASYVGFVNAEDTNVLTALPSLGTTADTNSPAGTYAITVSGAVAPNYTISYLDGTLTVVAVPQVQVKIASGNILLTFETLSNQNYQVQYKDNLSDASWTGLGAPIPGSGSSIISTNSISDSHRFFNVDITLGN